MAVAEVRERGIRVLLLLLQWIVMMTLWKVSVLHHRREWLMVVLLLLLLHWNVLLLVVRIHRLVSGVRRRRRRRGRDRRPVLPLTLLVGQRPGGLLGSAHVVPAEGDQLFPRRGEAGGGLERLNRSLLLSFVVARFLR